MELTHVHDRPTPSPLIILSATIRVHHTFLTLWAGCLMNTVNRSLHPSDPTHGRSLGPQLQNPPHYIYRQASIKAGG